MYSLCVRVHTLCVPRVQFKASEDVDDPEFLKLKEEMGIRSEDVLVITKGSPDYEKQVSEVTLTLCGRFSAHNNEITGVLSTRREVNYMAS